MAREVEGGRRGRKEWEGLGGKNGKPEPNMCPSSLENGKRRKEQTKGEWGAGAHLVAGSAGGCNRYMGGAWGVQGGCKGYRGPETNIFSLPYFFNTFMPSCPVMFRFMFR